VTKKTPTSTKAPAQRTDAAGNKTDQDVATLAEVPNPAKVTDAQIQDITKDDGTDLPHNTANADAAETLKQNRDDAKSDEQPRNAAFHGNGGGGAGEPG
jgi:hypothetical protein